jgi:hypothetical protein
MIASKQAFGCPFLTAVHKRSSCSEVFCSERCQQESVHNWHALECSEASSDPEGKSCSHRKADPPRSHPCSLLGIPCTPCIPCILGIPNSPSLSVGEGMVEFRKHALKTEEVFLAVCRVVTTLIAVHLHSLSSPTPQSLPSSPPSPLPLSPLPLSTLLSPQSPSSLGSVTDQLGEVDQLGGVEAQRASASLCAQRDSFLASFRHPLLPRTGGTVVQQAEGEVEREAEQAEEKGGTEQADRAHLEGSGHLTDLAEESWLLLYSALLRRGVSSLYAPLLSGAFYARVLCLLGAHLHSLPVASSPLPAHLLRHLSNRAVGGACSGQGAGVGVERVGGVEGVVGMGDERKDYPILECIG